MLLNEEVRVIEKYRTIRQFRQLKFHPIKLCNTNIFCSLGLLLFRLKDILRSWILQYCLSCDCKQIVIQTEEIEAIMCCDTTAFILHYPGALLVSILTSNKTWRTRNVVRSSNGDCEKTTQHFAMMSASDLFVGYMRSSMAS